MSGNLLLYIDIYIYKYIHTIFTYYFCLYLTEKNNYLLTSKKYNVAYLIKKLLMLGHIKVCMLFFQV